MKRTVISLIFPIFIGLFFTSCLPDAEEVDRTSTVAIVSFSINDLKTQHTVTLDSGKDSTYTTIMKASLIPFEIDHERGLVYNSDSIAYGTDVTHVLANVSADGYVFYYKDGEKTGYSKEDSIDFTSPVKFTVVSNDENFSRDYFISVNVHKIDPTKTEWKQLSGANFPAGLFSEQQAIINGQQIYVFGHDENGKYYTTSTAAEDGILWSDPAPWTGVEEGVDCSSVTLFNNMFYVLADNTLYRSGDGIAWEATAANGIDCLVAVTSEETPVAWGIKDNTFVCSEDMLTWSTNGQTVSGLAKRVAYFSEPLRTNPYIHRTIVIATSDVATDTCAKVWSKLSTETEWVEVKPVQNNPYGCPNLENLAVISYRDKMYAFGGKSIGNREPIEAFGTCYESRDNGITWRERDEAFKLAKDFAGRNENFSTVVDQKNRVWIIWSQSGEVWRGVWIPNN